MHTVSNAETRNAIGVGARYLQGVAIVPILILLTFVFAPVTRATPSVSETQPVMVAKQPHIDVQLVAETMTENRTRVGVLFKPEPGWHVYWSNPGDTGLAPTVEWQLPSESAASPLYWPAPEFIPIAHLVNLGYHHETLLWSDITLPSGALPKTALGESTPPDVAGAGAAVVSASLSWLVCKEACVPGKAQLSVDLASLSAAENAQAKTLFSIWEPKRPVPLRLMDASLSIHEDQISLELYASSPVFKNASDVDVFVENTDVVSYSEPLHLRAANNVLFWRQSLNDYYQSPPESLAVVIVVTAQDTEDKTAYSVTVPVRSL